MNRAERRRLKKEQEKSTKTYNFTKEQLDGAVRAAVRNNVQKIKDETTQEVSNTAFLLMLAIPVMVLHDKWWEKTAKKRCPKFVDQCLDLYDSFVRGDVTIEDLQQCLYEESGIKLERSNNPAKYY